MRRILPLTLLGLLAWVGATHGFDAPGIIKKVDHDKAVIVIFAGGQDRDLKFTADVKVLGKDGKPLQGGIKAKELKQGAEVTISVEPENGAPVLKAIRLGRVQGQTGRKDTRPVATREGKPNVGTKPLTDMTAEDRYQGEDGGLYGGGHNEPPPALRAAARAQTAKIVPLDAKGNPAKEGEIGLVSLSMSNATMEFSTFIRDFADKDPHKSSRVHIVDCAQGGQAMAQWRDPKGRAWTEADRRLTEHKLSPAQVQVIWVKLANVRPRGALTDHGKKLEQDTIVLLQNAMNRFPNLRIAYLSGRIYGGWAITELNPEPFAFESGIVCRWLIQDQMKGNPELNYDSAKGAVKSPLVLWGPYLWADGTHPRKIDGLVWERADLAADGTHPSPSGRKKVAEMLHNFFTQDPFAKTWYVK